MKDVPPPDLVLGAPNTPDAPNRSMTIVSFGARSIQTGTTPGFFGQHHAFRGGWKIVNGDTPPFLWWIIVGARATKTLMSSWRVTGVRQVNKSYLFITDDDGMRVKIIWLHTRKSRVTVAWLHWTATGQIESQKQTLLSLASRREYWLEHEQRIDDR